MARNFAWMLTLAAVLRVGSAAAQQEIGPMDANNVVAPRLRTDSPAPYPERALAEHVHEGTTVDLVLEIDATGRVKNAVVDHPVGHGFDEAAIAAAQKLVFDPATRGGNPIAAKIRFKYAFTPPPARVVGRIARQTSDAPIAGAYVAVSDAKGERHETTTAADGLFRVDGLPPGPIHVDVSADRFEGAAVDETVEPGEETSLVLRLVRVPEPAAPLPNEEPVQEVRVKGTRPPREVTKHSISRLEIAASPGTNGDALRALQNLPGVARPPPFSGQLVVRGSAPEDTQYFLDGTNVPIVYHFGGLSSVVPTEAIDKLDFYPGNFGAQYGRGMGGIVEIGLRDPNADGKFHGMAQLDSIDVRVLAERSLGKGWSFLVAGRRSYFDAWLKLLAGGGISTAPRYYDYQMMVRKEFGPEHDLRLVFLGSDDRLEIFNGQTGGGDFLLGGNIRAAIGFWRVQLRYQNKITPSTRISAMVSTGQDFVDFGFGENYADIKATPISARAEISQKVVRFLTVNGGIDLLDTPYEVTVRFPKIEKPGVPGGGIGAQSLLAKNDDTVYTPGAYGELEVQPSRATRIVPGFRADYTSQTREWNFSPRIVARQSIGGGLTAKGGIGYYYQPPSPFQLDPVFGQRGLIANRSVHESVGLEQRIGPHAELSVEGFYKKLDRLVAQENGNRGDGRIYGSETLLRWKNDPAFFGWLAYTISRSERRDDPSEPLRVFQYDQTHIFTILGSYAWGDGFRLGARFRVVSGALYTPDAYGGVLDVDRASYQSIGTLPTFNSRLEAFHQLDIRFEKSIQAKPLGKVTGYVDIQNVYSNRSVEGVGYSYDYSRSAPVRGLPNLLITGVRVDL